MSDPNLIQALDGISKSIDWAALSLVCVLAGLICVIAAKINWNKNAQGHN